MAKNNTVTITDNSTGKQVECPTLSGTLGTPVVDIRDLYRALGHFTHDPGFGTTSSCKSAITYIDGDQGILLYRGYPIDQLAEKSSYLEVCYLLMYGELPNEAQWDAFTATMSPAHDGPRGHATVPDGYRRIAHPMGMLVGLVGALSTFYHDSMDIDDPAQRELAAFRLIAKMPTIAADSYKYIHRSALHVPGSTRSATWRTSCA